jgi:hypothetical protein
MAASVVRWFARILRQGLGPAAAASRGRLRLSASVSGDGSTRGPVGAHRPAVLGGGSFTRTQCSRHDTPQCIDRPDSSRATQWDGPNGTDGSFQLYTDRLGENLNVICRS